MLLRIPAVVAFSLVVAIFSWSPKAFSYSRESSINYTVGTNILGGYSRTYKDLFDEDYYETCVWYAQDDIYGYYCYIWNLQINYAHVTSELDSPAGFYEQTIATNLYDAVATHGLTLTTQNGTWNEVGRHFAWVDHYTMYCPYNFCGGYFYDGSYTFSAGGNTGAQWAVIPMTVARYSTATSTDTDVDSILASASSLLQSNDGSGDVACPLSFDRNGTVATFSVGDGVINDVSEESAVHAVSPRVKVVNQILWCGGAAPPGTILGCTAGSSTILTRTTASLEPQLWAHEYGHTQALFDNTTTPGFVMYQTAAASNTRVTSYDCNAMTHPINSR